MHCDKKAQLWRRDLHRNRTHNLVTAGLDSQAEPLPTRILQLASYEQDTAQLMLFCLAWCDARDSGHVNGVIDTASSALLVTEMSHIWISQWCARDEDLRFQSILYLTESAH